MYLQSKGVKLSSFLSMPVNLVQYHGAVAVFNNCKVIANKVFELYSGRYLQQFFPLLLLLVFISTSNHIFGRALWNKFPECIFENFEIFQVK